MYQTVVYDNQTFVVIDKSKTQILSRTLFDAYDEGKEDWVILKDLYVWSHRLQLVIKVQKWFITDLASIPKIARFLISVNEGHRYAAVVHDWLYRNSASEVQDRRLADVIMLDILRICNVATWKRVIIYGILFFLGGLSFRKSYKHPFVPHDMRAKYQYD